MMRRLSLYALSAFTLTLLLGSAQLCLSAEKPQRQIVYAVRDIPANEERITDFSIRERQINEDVLKPNTVSKLADVVGKFAKRDISVGDIILDTDLQPIDFSPVTVVIKLTQTQLDQLTVVANRRTLSNSVLAREFVMKAVDESMK